MYYKSGNVLHIVLLLVYNLLNLCIITSNASRNLLHISFHFFYSFFIHISNELTELVIQCIFLQKQLKVFLLFLFLNDVRVLQHPKHILQLVFATRYYWTIIHPKSRCPTVQLLQEIVLCKCFHLRNGLFQSNDTSLRSGISNIFSFTNKNFFCTHLF